MVARREIARAQAAGEETPVIIHNLLTSKAVPELVAKDGGRAVRTRVGGHSFIKAVMAEEGAVFGGEHSAHFYFRDFWNADTGMLAAMHVLAAWVSKTAPSPNSDANTNLTFPPARSTPRSKTRPVPWSGFESISKPKTSTSTTWTAARSMPRTAAGVQPSPVQH